MTALKHEIEEMKKTNQEKLDHVVERLQLIDQKHSEQSEGDATPDETPKEVTTEKEKKKRIEETAVTKTDTRNETKVTSAESQQNNFKSDKCNFISLVQL